MPSSTHEGLVELVRDHPRLVAEMLECLFGLSVPTFAHARVESAELSQWQPTECRADAVVTLRSTDGEALLAAVVEIQRSYDPAKHYVWLLYVAALQVRLRCDVVLVVVALKRRVAAWAARPIPYGHPGLVLAPLVAGPDAIPVITCDDEAKAQPWLAVLSALAHWGHPQREAVFTALLDSLEVVNTEQRALYIDLIRVGLPQAARQILEGLMTAGTYTYRSDVARHYIAQGEARGEARGEANAILTVLATRELTVSTTMRERILGCTDTDQLTTWLQRAVTVAHAEDLLS